VRDLDSFVACLAGSFTRIGKSPPLEHFVTDRMTEPETHELSSVAPLAWRQPLDSPRDLEPALWLDWEAVKKSIWAADEHGLTPIEHLFSIRVYRRSSAARILSQLPAVTAQFRCRVFSRC
jgi:hypothetical protein